MPLSTKDAADAAITFTNYRQEGNKSVFIGPSHSDIVKQQILLTSASPKQTKESFGNRRSSMNNVSTVSVLNPAGETVRRDMKAEFLTSIPVGATLADFQELVANHRGLLEDPTFVEDLYLKGKIDQ